LTIPALLVLAAGTFTLGVDGFVLSGLLPQVAASLHVTASTAGQLTTLFALVYAGASPAIAALAGSWDRRALLAAGMSVFVLGVIVQATGPTFGAVAAGRVLAALGAAAYQATAYSAAGILSDDEHRARSLAVVAGGSSVALAAGLPFGILIGQAAGWRAAMWALVALGVLSAAAVGLLPPAYAPRLTLRQRAQALASRQVLGVLVGTVTALMPGLLLLAYLPGILQSSGPLVVIATLGYGVGQVTGTALVPRFHPPAQRQGSLPDRGGRHHHRVRGPHLYPHDPGPGRHHHGRSRPVRGAHGRAPTGPAVRHGTPPGPRRRRPERLGDLPRQRVRRRPRRHRPGRRRSRSAAHHRRDRRGSRRHHRHARRTGTDERGRTSARRCRTRHPTMIAAQRSPCRLLECDRRGNPMGRYNGKNIVITGGSSGSGLAAAQLLAGEGARVMITGRRQDALDHARQQIGSSAIAVRSDTASLADITSLADRARTELGQLDLLFASAGVTRYVPFESMTEDIYDELQAINAKGPYFTAQKLAPLIREGGSIVFTTSIANSRGLPMISAYAAAKAALRSMTRSLATELLPQGVRVNAISPGPIDTGILERALPGRQAAATRQQMIQNNPLKRFGYPAEIAHAVAFLAFEATYTTGFELAIDGGVSQL
jgi:NAD(P)-dependent dehydrogenase (short-subunit alcohol dehydrogenase family)